jgi:diketogulonate reductase-like aldo/keto reductase
MMMKSIPLNVEASIPVLGLGTWNLLGDECERAVEHALTHGYCHLDTADAYGNHAEVAGGIKASGVKREDIFITTKVWRTDLTHDSLIESAHRLLEELATEYIDLLLIHWPNRDIPIEATLRAMEELRRAGKIRAIGVSNFTEHHLEDALKTGIAVVNNQVEVHPTFNQKELRIFCAARSISVTAYSPLGHGADVNNSLMRELAQKYDKTPAQIALNWVVARGMIAIPKTSRPERIIENLEAIDFEMEERDLERIDNLSQGPRLGNPAFSDFEY